MRLPPSLQAMLDRPGVRRWIDAGRQATERTWLRLEPYARRVRVRHVVIAAILVAAVGAAVIIDVVRGAPTAEAIHSIGNLPVATVVLDRNDEPAFTIFAERRYEVPLDRISPHLVQAVIAIEDQRFRDHAGVDPWRIAGSAWANLWSGDLEQGGSTITQQLAKLTFLSPDKTFRRKLREAYLALRIERVFSKDEILEIYLNKVYFGDGLHGVEAASRGYFGKTAADLTLAEAALLAGIIQRPSAYAPEQFPDRATARRAIVLDQMAAAGMIDAATRDRTTAEPLALTDGFVHERTGAFFEQAVTRELVERFGWEQVSQGGLRVYTTYDPVAQAAAEAALVEGLAAIEGRSGFRHPRRGDEAAMGEGDESPDYLQGALVALEPATGRIRALVGGRDFAESQFDRVTQASRQSGSAFKPFVYAAALEQGYSPATLVTDLDQPIDTPQGPWLPDDGHADHITAMTLRSALRTSSNRAAAHLLQTVGVAEAVDTARRVGLDAPPVASLVLGTGDVTLLALTAAYGVFANGGELTEPFIIRRIEDRSGTVLHEREPASTRVISEATAYQITGMLADVIDRGTGAQARQSFQRPAAGKTGTTNEYRDAWFVGYTPDLVAGAWVGFDRPRTIVPGGYASELAVPIWGAFMRDATADAPGRGFDRPGDVVGVEVCEASGLLPHSACSRARSVSDDGEVTTSRVITEYFRRGTEPTAYCPLHDTTWYGRVQTTRIDEADLPSASTISLGGPPVREEARRDDESDEPASPEESGEVEEEEPRRGFWGRVFGVFRGSDDDDGDNDRNRNRDGDGRD